MPKKTEQQPFPARLALYGGTIIDAETAEPVLLWGTHSPEALDRSLDLMHLLVDAYNRVQSEAEQLIPAALVAKMKGVDPDTVRAAVHSGRLSGRKIGSAVMVQADAVDTWNPQDRAPKGSRKARGAP